MNSRLPAHLRSRRGVSLLFALITLVALSLSAVALVRSVSTSSLIVGNLGFKQDSIAHASQAAEDAIAYLDANKKTIDLDSDQSGAGYYATAHENLDPTNRRPTDVNRLVIDWDGNACASYPPGSFKTPCLMPFATTAGPSGNKASYLITRLCTSPGPATDPANSCARPIRATVSESGEKGELNYARGRPADLVEGGPYYRVVVRSVGARNTVSFTETIVHF